MVIRDFQDLEPTKQALIALFGYLEEHGLCPKWDDGSWVTSTDTGSFHDIDSFHVDILGCPVPKYQVWVENDPTPEFRLAHDFARGDPPKIGPIWRFALEDPESFEQVLDKIMELS